MKFNRSLNEKIIRRGDIWYADLGEGKGSEQQGIRPVVIVQNNMGNRYSTNVTVVPLTSQLKKELPTHVYLIKNEFNNLQENSIALIENIVTINKERISSKIRLGEVTEITMKKIDNAITTQLDLNKNDNIKFKRHEIEEKRENILDLKESLKYVSNNKIKQTIMDAIKIQYRDIKEYLNIVAG